MRSLLNNQPAVAIPIFQRPGFNAIAISDLVREKMAELKTKFPEGVDYSIVYDPTVFVRGSIEAVVNDDALEATRELLAEDQLLIVQGKVQNDRFRGGSLRLNASQAWDLPAARARFGRYLAVQVNGGVPPVADVIRTWPVRRSITDHGELAHGLAVRLQLQRHGACAEVDLGDEARFWRTDEALARWRQVAHRGQAAIVYESKA